MNGMTSQHTCTLQVHGYSQTLYVIVCWLYVSLCLIVCVGFRVSTNFVHTVAYNVYLCLVNSNARYSSKSTLQVPVNVV